MNVILPRYAGAIAESVVNEPVEVEIAVDEAASAPPAINAAATKTDGLGCHAGAAELKTAAGAAGKSRGHIAFDQRRGDQERWPGMSCRCQRAQGRR
jgi:hypothetical protein